jgi:hypothetical protein
VVSLVLQVTGAPVDWSLVLDRLPAYAGTFGFVLLLGGAVEEPGWRGFGLPLLHASFTPAQDQLILMARSRAYTDVLDAPDWAILGIYLIAVLVLVAVTRGRLGRTRTQLASSHRPG